MRKFLAALLTLCLALTLVAPIAMAEEKSDHHLRLLGYQSGTRHEGHRGSLYG